MSRAQGWLARAAEIAVTAVALAAFIVLLIFVRGRTGPLPAGAQLATEPAARLAAAAALLEVSTAAGRPGYTFEIVQRSTITARPGGPKIEIPDPTDRTKSLGLADTCDVGALIERGAVTPDGFWMEMRTGPAAGKDPDWTSAYQFGGDLQRRHDLPQRWRRLVCNRQPARHRPRPAHGGSAPAPPPKRDTGNGRGSPPRDRAERSGRAGQGGGQGHSGCDRLGRCAVH